MDPAADADPAVPGTLPVARFTPAKRARLGAAALAAVALSRLLERSVGGPS